MRTQNRRTESAYRGCLQPSSPRCPSCALSGCGEPPIQTGNNQVPELNVALAAAKDGKYDTQAWPLVDGIMVGWLDGAFAPGCAVGVAIDDEIVYLKGYGRSRLGLDAEDWSVSTMGSVASVSKTFTALGGDAPGAERLDGPRGPRRRSPAASKATSPMPSSSNCSATPRESAAPRTRRRTRPTGPTARRWISAPVSRRPTRPTLTAPKCTARRSTRWP